MYCLGIFHILLFTVLSSTDLGADLSALYRLIIYYIQEAYYIGHGDKQCQKS